jgi:phosphoribosylformimino-5-aminoimidazole carboxamide ribonucleotide (ProFAR) isomerase
MCQLSPCRGPALRRGSAASLGRVAFEVLPAIDVAGGRLVSSAGGAVRPIEAFGGSPLAAAEAFVQAGARWLHVVDVDRAAGRAPDLALLGRIAGVGAAVQASGGIDSIDVAEQALRGGATRVVLTSAVLLDVELAQELASRLGDRAVIGIEADGDVIRPRSAGAPELPLRETLEWLAESEMTRYLYTGLARVAWLGGPDIEGVRRVAAALRRPILAAGGIRGVDDLLALRALGGDVAAGCVVGRALYEGLDVRTALRAVGRISASE